MNSSFYQGGYMALLCQKYSGIIKLCLKLQMTFSVVLRKIHTQGTYPWKQRNTALLDGLVHEISMESSYDLHLLCPLLLQGHEKRGLYQSEGMATFVGHFKYSFT